MTEPEVTVLIPAHNEAATIEAAITSLHRQTVQPDRVIVICDNCDDDTEYIARSLGVRVFITRRNAARKAGALNQVLTRLVPYLDNQDFLVVMDADSTLSPHWIETALLMLHDDARAGAVCGRFLGEPGNGIIGQIQRNEYLRYARIMQRRWQALVLSGTGTMFRAPVLQQIACNRGDYLPGKPGTYYSESSITEDDEITLAVKSLGWRCMCPAECVTITEVMPGWRELWTQRMRWQKGTLSDLREYGLSRITFWYWLRQAGLYGGFTLSFTVLTVMIAAMITSPGVSVPWLFGVLGFTVAERTITVWRGGWRAMALAITVLPEAYYAVWQGCLFAAAARAAIGRHELEWGHIEREVPGNAETAYQYAAVGR